MAEDPKFTTARIIREYALCEITADEAVAALTALGHNYYTVYNLLYQLSWRQASQSSVVKYLYPDA